MAERKEKKLDLEINYGNMVSTVDDEVNS